jgi:hypothetical protein
MPGIKDVLEDANPLYKLFNDIQSTEYNAAHEINEFLGVNKHRPNLKRRFEPNIIRDDFKKIKSSPLNNSPSSNHRSINTGSHGMSNNLDGEEVAVMPVPRSVAKSHPDYFSIRLPMYTNFVLVLNSTSDITEHFVRLNSPYDPNLSSGGRPSGQPLGRDQWANIYDYYRVIESTTNIQFTYLRGLFGSDQTGSFYPALGAGQPAHALVGYQITEDVTKKAADPIAFVEQKHSKVDPLHPSNTEFISDAGYQADGSDPSFPTRLLCTNGHTGMSFYYRPENWDQHVTLQGPDARWTAKDASPAHTHLLGITAAYPWNTTGLSTNDSIFIHVSVYQTFTVQWREVNDAYKRTIDNAQ